jgi:hypothetical protein
MDVHDLFEFVTPSDILAEVDKESVEASAPMG